MRPASHAADPVDLAERVKRLTNTTRRFATSLAKLGHDRFVVRLFAALALSIAIIAGLTDSGQRLEQDLQLWRDSILRHAASGRIVLVEIDARSLKELNHWPWPRSLHARALTALDRGGAATVAFDTDFAAKSDPVQDATLAHAIAASHTAVFMPTFRQAGSQGSHDMVENLPLAELRDHAQLGSVNIAPDPDGFVRSMPYGVITAGYPRPSMAAMLSGTSGRANTSFPIDGSIDESTIPRLSFADLVKGRVPASFIHGRSFLIGATAVEMGDRYAVPGHGVIPGALIQLLAAETLTGQTTPQPHGMLPGLAVLLLIVLIRLGVPRLRHLGVTLLCAGALLLLPLALQAAKLGVIGVVPAMLGLAVLAVGDTIAATLMALRESRMTDPQTGLPNARALRENLRDDRPGHIVVMRLGNYADMVNVLGRARATVAIQRVAQRLGVLTTGVIYHVEPNALGWIDPGHDHEIQTEQVEAGVALFNQAVDVEGRMVRIAPAFGISATTHGAARALDCALIAADQALAKGVRWDWYHATSDAESDWRLSLAAEVGAAIMSGAITVVYQPQYEFRTKKIAAAEALVRWNHPERGPINPESLIALVEEHGLIERLTLHVLQTALKDQRRWIMNGVALHVAVNISALLPGNGAFITDVEVLLKNYPGAAENLTLEITESAQMIQSAEVLAALEHLRTMGITISIDDYGTGQSTLSYLRNLPASEIKIDKSFVIGMEANRSDQLMVASTIALAHALNFKVVAEGVETQATLDMLAEAGCDFAQGWHIGRPMLAADLQALAARCQHAAA